MVLGCFKDNTVFALTLVVTSLVKAVEMSDTTINCRKKPPGFNPYSYYNETINVLVEFDYLRANY